jgi:polysaccharide pyruvyl transferase WcaK-like protein
VISISFHQKCDSLMSMMGLSDYCQDIKQLESDKLIEQFIGLQSNAENLKSLIKRKTEEFRMALDEQYEVIFRDARRGNESPREIRWWHSRWSE